MEKYIKAIRDNVCSICVDSTEAGDCTLTKNEVCAVQYFLPKIVEVVHKVEDDDFEKYYQELKEHVCSDCKAATEDGENCYLRDDANCSLDRYFNLIVETIQKVDAAEK